MLFSKFVKCSGLLSMNTEMKEKIPQSVFSLTLKVLQNVRDATNAPFRQP